MAAETGTGDALDRILLLVPTKRDVEITSSLLRKAGMGCVACQDMPRLIQAIHTGGEAILLTEEVLATSGIQRLLDALKQQPAWSDLPVVMLMKGGAASVTATRALSALSNLTIVDRPAPIRSVISAVQAAVRNRHRQYQIRDQLETIRAARQDAENANRMKDEFLATLSHELRSPLSAIFGWVQIINRSCGDPAAISDGIQVIDRNVRMQIQLIEDLLDMSRIVSGKVRLDLQSINIHELVDAVLESVSPLSAAKEIHLEKQIDPAIGPLVGDPSRLQQVLWNLLSNAVKFTPKGGHILVAAEPIESRLRIRVRDTGEGIPPDFQPQLFDRFTQADASITRRHGGLGLGLSIVRNLVEMHGGTVRAESPGLGQGATFIIELPAGTLADRPEAGPAGETAKHFVLSRARTLLKGVTVLVVDDEFDEREIVRRVLMECEATPILASSAAEGHSLLATSHPDIIVSDIGMPLYDGYEFMKAVRVQGIQTPAVALTAFAGPEDRMRSIQAGFQRHLSKPVESEKLIAVIANLAGRYGSLMRD